MLSRKWVVKRAVVYALAAMVITAVLSVKDGPGEPPLRFTCDQIRPFLAGVCTFVAFSCWFWATDTALETWQYTRFWVLSFMMTLTAGVALLVFYEVLSKLQGTHVLMGMAAGALVGFADVLNTLDKPTSRC